MENAQVAARITPLGRRGGATRAWHSAKLAIVLTGRVALILGTAAVAGVSVVATIRSGNDTLAVAAPLGVVGGLLLIIRQTYLVVRQAKWRARRQREAAANAALRIPEDVRSPSDAGVDTIRRVKVKVMHKVSHYQGTMFLRGLTVAVLPPIAVLLAAVPSFAPHDSYVALGTSIAEIVVLLTAFGIVRRSAKPAESWVAARTRTELLRREEYLRLALVGPYLNRPDDAADLIRQRIAELDPNDEASRARVIGMRDDLDGRRWIDQMWTHPYQPLPELRERMRSYLHYRIRKQIVWFELGAAESDGSDRTIMAFTKVSLMVAVGVVAAQVLFRQPWPVDTASAAQVATLLALVLPTVSAFLLAVRQLYAYRALAASYTHMINGLKGERRAVERLLGELDKANADEADIGREFQATVLHTEAFLTDELQRWIMIIDRDQLDLDA